MKSTKIITLIFLLASNLILAQERVYLTYSDFRINKSIVADPNTFTVGEFSFDLSLKFSGKEMKWEWDKVWGYVYDKGFYRSIKTSDNHPARVGCIGNYVLYALSGVKINPRSGGQFPYTHYYISKGIDGICIRVDDPATLEKAVKEHPEFKEIAELVKKNPGKGVQ